MSIFFSKDVIYINSALRSSGTSSSFTIDISKQISTPNNYDRITLLNFQCPKSYYLINSTNNTFIITESGINHTVTLIPGNYSLTSLTTEINAEIIASGVSYTYQFLPMTTLGKYKIIVTGNSSIQPVINFSLSNLYLIIGFDKLVYTMSGNTLISTNVVNLQLTNTVQLLCDSAERSLLSVIIPNKSDYS